MKSKLNLILFTIIVPDGEYFHNENVSTTKPRLGNLVKYTSRRERGTRRKTRLGKLMDSENSDKFCPWWEKRYKK